MLVVEVTFQLAMSAAPEASEAVTHVLAAWLKNGQIEVDWQLIEREKEFIAITLVPDQAALDPANANQYVREAMECLAPQGVSTPSARIRGPNPDFDPACTCEARPSLILFTNLLSKASPVRCGTCFMPVPLYQLPHTQDLEHLNILQWAADYRACDTLQMHCTTGERFGEGQLASHDGSLSRQGRAIASALANRTGVPVYYYLFKARGRTRATELKRTCPSCRGEWRLPEPWHRQFEFRCDTCSLLSNIACSLNG